MARFILMTTLVCALAPLACTAEPVPLDEVALRRTLLRLPRDGLREAEVRLPTGPDASALFRVRDSRTLPYALGAKFPGLRSFRGHDAHGHSVRLDLSAQGVRASIRNGTSEWVIRPGRQGILEHTGHADLAYPDAVVHAETGSPPIMTSRSGGTVRHEFRLAVAASSEYTAKFGGTVEGALAEIVHAVNRANEVFETDAGVHFTLVENNDRIIRTDPRRDPYRRSDPGPATVTLIDRQIGKRNYDIGHAVTTLFGGESNVGTSCSDDRSADFHATHKAAAWSGHARPESESYAIGFMIHVLARQLGAWPTANGCIRSTLDDRAFEPGGGSTVMGFAPTACGGDAQWLQPRSDLYFHAANIGQMRRWLEARGGHCASKRLHGASAPWIDATALAELQVIPARTPFMLDATATSIMPDRHLTYAWEQMDAGREQRGPLVDRGDGPLFRSWPPASTGQRTFPRLAAVLGHETAEPAETLPTTSRQLTFRLTVRDNGGDSATVAHADTRIQVIDTGRPFALEPTKTAISGSTLTLRWDVAGTNLAPISCHFLVIDLSIDGGEHWLEPALAVDERNDGEAEVLIPADTVSKRARLRARCDWRPFFAVSPADFPITAPAR